MLTTWLALPGLLIWTLIFLLPWRPWLTREHLESIDEHTDLSQVTVIIPARNEANIITRTLGSLAVQGNIAGVLLIDDESTDGTSRIASNTDLPGLEIVHGKPLPDGWTGKLWALEQGLKRANTEFILLLDADIELSPGILSALRRKIEDERFGLVSLMASLRMKNAWEKLLMPAFIYFFKLLYPFAVSNSGSKSVAAAAGGCILIRKEVLDSIGGFAGIRGELIDDCALARQVKSRGYRTWIGLSRSVRSHREYTDLASIWNMVARTAYTQLAYSPVLLILCTALLFTAFIVPLAAIFTGPGSLTLTTFCLIWGTYMPIIRYYSLHPLWTLSLPVAGVLYLLMTWSSAFQHWNGRIAAWKNREYNR